MDTLVESLPMSAVQGGVETQHETFEELIRQFGGSIYRMAHRLTGNEADAEDLAQEAILEAFRAFHRFRPGSSFMGWISRIMTHTFIDAVRTKRRHPLDPLESASLRQPFDRQALPEEVVVHAEERAAVHQALATLPPAHRLAVVLIDLEDLSYEEASAIMRCPIGTVRSRLHRGRSMLRDRLSPHLGEV